MPDTALLDHPRGVRRAGADDRMISRMTIGAALFTIALGLVLGLWMTASRRRGAAPPGY